MKIQRDKLIILITVFIDVIGIGIVIPVLPYYVQNFGGGAQIITLLFAVYSLCSFISMPFLGVMSDKIGRRPALLISLASTALGWFVFAMAGNILFLFVGRIIDGLAAGNFPIAQTYLSDISKDQQERTHNMGLVGAIFGIGFIIGPAVGALLANYSMSLPFWIVGVLATLNTLAAIKFLPETNKNLVHDKVLSYDPFFSIKSAWADTLLRSRYFVVFLFSLAIAIQQSIFTLFTQYAFGFGVKEAGYVLGGVGLVMAVNQGYFLKNVWLKYFSDAQLEVWVYFYFAVGYLLMDISNLYVFIIGTLVMVFAQSILRAVVSSRTVGLARKDMKGEVTGIMSSIMMLGMVVGPLVSGVFFGLNEHLPFIVSAVILFGAFWYMWIVRSRSNNIPYVHEEVEPVEVI